MAFDPGIELMWTLTVTILSIVGALYLFQYCLSAPHPSYEEESEFPGSKMISPGRSHGRKQRHYYRKHARRLRQIRSGALGWRRLLRYCCWSTGWFQPPKGALEGEVALVTGAATGIGVEIAYQLGELGASVILADVDVQGIREVADDMTVQFPDIEVWVTELDVSDQTAVFALADELETIMGENRYVSILVNNAGIVHGKTIGSMSTEEYDRTMAVNSHGPFYLTKALLPPMIEGGHGHIVGLSSIMGSIGSSQLVDYCASKAAHSAMMDALRLEIKSENLQYMIRLLTVLPSVTNTGMFAGAFTQYDLLLRRLLAPTLTAPTVANHVVDGILYDKEVVTIPQYFGIVIQLIKILPTPLIDSILGYLGGYWAMQGFQGRNGDNTARRLTLDASDDDTGDEEEKIEPASVRKHSVYNVSSPEGPVTYSHTSRDSKRSSRTRARSVGVRKRSRT